MNRIERIQGERHLFVCENTSVVSGALFDPA
jgi:hypothetical protein